MLMQSSIKLKKTSETHKWSILADLWDQKSVLFSKNEDGWRIRELLEDKEIFSLRRDYITSQRYTDVDIYGLLGLSRLDLNKSSVCITEGVSDYFTTSLLLPDFNILGVTQLGGSHLAKKILISLFKNVTIIADTDATGLANAYRWRGFLRSYGITAKIWQPSIGKDITDEFLFNYKSGDEIYF